MVKHFPYEIPRNRVKGFFNVYFDYNLVFLAFGVFHLVYGLLGNKE